MPDATPQSPAISDPAISYEIHPSIAYEDQLLTRERAAIWLGIHPDTLGIWERQQRSPKVTRGAAKIRYRLGMLGMLASQRDAPPEARKRQHTMADTASRKLNNQKIRP
jgi:hypothetical protein